VAEPRLEGIGAENGERKMWKNEVMTCECEKEKKLTFISA
jgi:hypothetical protein